MTKQEITDVVNVLIQKGKVKEVLEHLANYVKGKDRYLENDLLLQTASFNRNKRDFNRGMISQGNFNVALARLNNALLEIMDQLPEKGNAVSTSSNGVTASVRKILFLSANPKHTLQLRLGEELRKIKDSMSMATLKDQFDLEIEPAVKISTITKAMQVQKPEIVHFFGHGAGSDGIHVEDDSGHSVLFPTEGLGRLFKNFKDTSKCVVLNACYSKAQAEVISEHGIYVVGMNDAIGDKAAIDFSVGFYQSIGEGNDYEFAFDMALVNNSTNLKYADTPELWLNGSKLDV
ncbi:hypothetical protein [Aquimarina mytili]|uniref:CHAT domain-containing protein n=1 Tax=Aquimarina mytili TaxID=874423 RepID=A0A936ZWN0_9FLAO|nr:hypothetical protein [Aquimarina mytili]MBL0683318.1 hypothetical protein [Aquimarina mytili]